MSESRRPRAYQVFLTHREGGTLEEDLSAVAGRVVRKVAAPLTEEEHRTYPAFDEDSLLTVRDP